MDVFLLITTRSGRGAGPIVLACLVALPLALVLSVGAIRSRGRGPTWRELLGPVARLRDRTPATVLAERPYALLLTERDELVLVPHHRHHHPLYWTVPGGHRNALVDSIGATAAAAIHEWRLVHTEDHAGHRDQVFTSRIERRHVDSGRFDLVELTPAALAHRDIHPHSVAHAIAQVMTGPGPGNRPDPGHG